MAKSRSHKLNAATTSPAKPEFKTTSELKSDTTIGYKLKVLLYDLRNVAKDKSSEQRILTTTDELYLNVPYFSSDEAACIKAAIVDHAIPSMHDEVEDNEDSPAATIKPHAVENCIHNRLGQFLEKRRASGDARPFGPHDLAPVYEAVLGISREELDDEKFLGRLRRQGLQNGQGVMAASTSHTSKK